MYFPQSKVIGLTNLFNRDWKKLTFYYFADSYINFNSLVTDLFKVYKTRIWMSAMNPASFAHPHAGTVQGSDPSNDQTPQLLHHGLNSYSQIAPSGQLRQQYQSILSPPQTHVHGPNFSPRGPIGHPDFSHLQQQQLQPNGYPTQYMNGAGSALHQGSLGNGAASGIIGNAPGSLSGTGPDWMSLQGLSLQSH